MFVMKKIALALTFTLALLSASLVQAEAAGRCRLLLSVFPAVEVQSSAKTADGPATATNDLRR